MTNLLTVLPEFDIRPFTHILPSLEKALISTADLLTLDAVDVAKRAQVPPGEVRKLNNALLNGLHNSTPSIEEGSTSRLANGGNLVNQWQVISTLDDHLDATLGGGVPTGHLVEFVGESAAGKTQFLMTLLLSVQLLNPGGPAKSALYISTEAPLQTTRLSQILATHPKLARLESDTQPSLSRIHSTHIHDLEAQEHILRYQVPVIIERHNVGLIVVDSIAANIRPEFSQTKGKAGAESFVKRSSQLQNLGTLLHDLGQKHNLAVVVANQVSDRFAAPPVLVPSASQQSYTQHPSQPTPHTPSSTQSHRLPQPSQSVLPSHALQPVHNATTLPAQLLSTDDPLSLDHQQCFFTGWGDDLNPSASMDLKTPSLGLVWTNQLDMRIALLKESKQGGAKWKRTMKVVFSPMGKEGLREFELWEGGVRAVQEGEDVPSQRK